MQILKIKCCRKDSLLDKLCDYLKTYHIPHIAFVDGNCFAIYVDDKDFNLEQINGFEFEYESDVYIKDGKTYLDTGISYKLLKIKTCLKEIDNMTHNAWEHGENLTIHNANKEQLKWMVEDRESRIKKLQEELEKCKEYNKTLIENLSELVDKVKKMENN